MPRKRKELNDEAAFDRMAALCARSEQSTGEVRQKLYRLGIGGERSDAIISRLVEERFIDNARYARAYVSDKMRFAYWGRRKIRIGLRAKGVDESYIVRAMDEIDMDEYREIMLRLGRAKIKSMKLDLLTVNDRGRLYMALVGRGYEPAFMSGIISTLCDEWKADRSEE